MAWCENPHCGKTGLRKADVEFDDESRRVLCHGCMTLIHPGWVPPNEYVDLTGFIPTVVRTEPQFGMAIQINEQDGIKAAFSYGGMSLTLHIPNEDLRNMLGT
jgi:hypothetical protein